MQQNWKQALTKLYTILTGEQKDFTTYCTLTDNEGEIDTKTLEIGSHKQFWTTWTIEKQLEVILHEFAHINEQPHHRDHGYAFYTRLQQLATTTHANKTQIETLFNEEINYTKLRDLLIKSVNEETIEPDMRIPQVQLYLNDTLPPDN